MYPWKEALSSWADSTKLRVDALGLVTILGADEVNASVGRLVPSRYVEFLPLLGAFVVAGNRFTQKQPGFFLYNLSSEATTTELAGWFSRWLKAQDFHQVHHKLRWDVQKPPVARPARFWTALVVGVLCNGILVALTVLAGDWWGFANVMAMVVSVIVRAALVWQNRAGIDMVIEEHSGDLRRRAKVIVIMDDSKVITMDAPEVLIGPIFAGKPKVPNPSIYGFARWAGWVAFAVHIVSIGMASLSTQICTVVLLLVSTILTVTKFSCDDWNMRKHIADEMKRQRPKLHTDQQDTVGAPCWISSRLMTVCSEYPIEYEDLYGENCAEDRPDAGQTAEERACESRGQRRVFDEETHQSNACAVPSSNKKRTERRQDLYVWLDLTNDELDAMKAWNLVPRQNMKSNPKDEKENNQEGNEETAENLKPSEKWWQEYWKKRKIHEKRLSGREGQERNHSRQMPEPEKQLGAVERVQWDA